MQCLITQVSLPESKFQVPQAYTLDPYRYLWTNYFVLEARFFFQVS